MTIKREPIFLLPIFQERIWGGRALADHFGYEIPSDRTGECWAISGHANGQSIVKNGEHQGTPLGELWKEHPELFGHFSSESFPLLAKILDANADLSVQVHPDDAYAREHANGELGKTECWYIIDCKPGAQIVYGHNARTKQELQEQIQRGEWDQLLRKVSIKPGDFFYVPSGTIHALGAGTLVLETQQSSDTTYRVYDYDRTDDQGKRRELHLDRAIDVTTVPHVDATSEPFVEQLGEASITHFIRNEFFTVQKWNVDGKAAFIQDQPFMLFNVLDGQGVLETSDSQYPIGKGDHFLLPSHLGRFAIGGSVEMIVSHP